jgi:hypothetical protein
MGELIAYVCRRTDGVLAFEKNGWVNQVHMVDRFFHSPFSKEKSHDIRHPKTHNNRSET